MAGKPKVDELTIRRRTVKGWAFRNTSERERSEIEAWLSFETDTVPMGYSRRYELERKIAQRGARKNEAATADDCRHDRKYNGHCAEIGCPNYFVLFGVRIPKSC
jgi:hypothetical protein